MRFYRNNDLTNFIATDETRSVVITKTRFVNRLEVFDVPFKKMEGAVYEESTHDEFFAEYDTLTSFMISLVWKQNGKGLGALLTDAKK